MVLQSHKNPLWASAARVVTTNLEDGAVHHTINQDRKLRSYSGMRFCESECHWEPKLPGNFGPIWEPP